MAAGTRAEQSKRPHVDVWCSFGTLNLWMLRLTKLIGLIGRDQAFLFLLHSSYIFFFFIFTLHRLQQKTGLLNSSCGGMMFLLRMINEGSSPQKPEVFFSSDKRCWLSCWSVLWLLAHLLFLCLFFIFFPRVLRLRVCLWVCVSCLNWCNELRFWGGGICNSPLSDPSVHDCARFSFHHSDIYSEARPPSSLMWATRLWSPTAATAIAPTPAPYTSCTRTFL